MDLIDGDDDYDFEDVSKYKLDDTKYGADYPLNYDQDIFRFLKSCISLILHKYFQVRDDFQTI